jgi:hypothetical protein
MSNPSNEFLDSRLTKELSALRDMPPRDPAAAQRGRDRFLSEAKSMGETVSPSKNMRHSITNANKIWTFLSGKTNTRLAISPILAIVLAIALVLGSTGTTVYASQSSQPDQLLYPVKLWTEDVRLQLTSDPLARIQLDQEFADRRVAEIAWMVQSGKEIGEGLTTRFEMLMDDALLLATTLDDKGGTEALTGLKVSFLHQQVQLAEIKNKADPRAVSQVNRLTAMMDLGLQLAETGIRDPEALRKLYKETVHPGKPTEVQASSTPKMTDTSEPTQTPGANDKDKATKDPGLQVTHTPKPPVDTPDNKPATKTPKPLVDTPDNKPATKTPKPPVDTPDVKPTKPPADTPEPKPTKPPADTQAPAKTKNK